MRALSRWFLAVALGVTAGAMSSGGAQAGVETPHVSQGTSISWRTCGERLECARVPVPLDWDRPRGRTISLAVIRHLASRPDERIGSLFVNPGGPGQSGVGLVKGSGNDLDAWGDGRFTGTRRVAGAELMIVPGGTHYLAVEYPELVNLRIEKFFRERGYGVAA